MDALGLRVHVHALFDQARWQALVRDVGQRQVTLRGQGAGVPSDPCPRIGVVGHELQRSPHRQRSPGLAPLVNGRCPERPLGVNLPVNP
jgi:hypothetical protein